MSELLPDITGLEIPKMPLARLLLMGYPRASGSISKGQIRTGAYYRLNFIYGFLVELMVGECLVHHHRYTTGAGDIIIDVCRYMQSEVSLKKPKEYLEYSKILTLT